MPSGRFLMEDFYYAGGLPAVLRTLGENGLLNKDALTVNGKTHLGELPARRRPTTPKSSVPFDKPLVAHGGIAVLRGNLAPRWRRVQAVGRVAAPDKHRGRAVVFETIEHYNARIDDPDLDVDASACSS